MNILRKSLLAMAALAATASLAACGSKADAQAETAAAGEQAEEMTSVGAAAPAVTELEKGAALPAEPGKLVVVDFNATWCGPCKQFAPNFEAVAEKYADKALFYSVDVDQHPELAARYNVQSLPMVVYIRPDGQTATSLGYLEEPEFDTLVASQLK